jgi:anti-sigma B factor antagonist
MIGSNPHFTIVGRPEASDLVIKAQGDIDLHSAARFQEALLDGLVAWPTRLIVDLADVTSIDLSGVDVLINAHQRGRNGGTELVLQAPGPAVRRVLEKTGVADLVPVRREPSTVSRPRLRRPFPTG